MGVCGIKYVVIALVLIATVIPVLSATAVNAQEIPNRFWWLYRGLRVAYLLTYSYTKSSPGSPYVPGSEWAPSSHSKAGVTSAFYTYVITDVSRDSVKVKYVMWTFSSTGRGPVLKDEYRVAPAPDGFFDGPFWIDPARVANVRVGDTVMLGDPGKKRPYKVMFVGRVDISPLTESTNQFIKMMKKELAIPLPPGTYRDVVVLYTSERNPRTGQKEYHTIIVDKATGLILLQTLRGFASRFGEVAGVSVEGQLTTIALAEITLDLENKLPPYSNYDFGPYVHAGYGVCVGGLITTEQGVNWMTVISGVYKDKASVIDIYSIASSTGVASEASVVLVNLRTGEGRVVFNVAYTPSPMRRKGDTYKLIPIYIGKYVNEDTIEVMGITYRSEGYKEVTASNGEVVKLKVFTAENAGGLFSLAKLYYMDNGLLVAAVPGVNGYPIQMAAAMTNTLDLITSLPHYKPSPPNPPKQQVITQPQTMSPQETKGKEGLTTSKATETLTKKIVTTVITVTKTVSKGEESTTLIKKNVITTKASPKAGTTESKSGGTTTSHQELSVGIGTKNTSTTSTTTSKEVTTTKSRGGGGNQPPNLLSYLAIAVVTALAASLITAIILKRR